jgi:hypothetical protein
LINILGTSGGLITPPIIGWVRVTTGTFTTAAYLLAGLLMGGAALLTVIYRSNLQHPSVLNAGPAAVAMEKQ